MMPTVESGAEIGVPMEGLADENSPIYRRRKHWLSRIITGSLVSTGKRRVKKSERPIASWPWNITPTETGTNRVAKSA
jgi:hypothetical protein